ncbi:MAG: hypothetical protein IJ429_02095 [Lachnospiraceae bacterium]|nr:hypothetical protein [Lachnospiraceae bacterium]
MNKYYKALELLAELAGEYGENEYSITDYVFGFIPFKNGKNVSKDVGTEFAKIAHWLIDESVTNFENNK